MLLTFDHDVVRELKLNRPPVNALTIELIVNLRQAIEAAPKDSVRAIVISGAPGRFCAGLDLPVLVTLGREEIQRLWKELYALLRAIATSPVPIVAALTGHAPAAGAVITLFCDWRIMAEGEFKVGLNEVRVGLPVPPLLLAGLRRLVGPHRAERLAVSGVLISPICAQQYGLVDELAPVQHIVDRAVKRCHQLLELPPGAMTTTRQLARAELAELFAHDLSAELESVMASWYRPEAQTTIRAVVEKLGKKSG
jgi:enoyl-CoA hydratase/carnithine racemase